jgi:hypothetical protein
MNIKLHPDSIPIKSPNQNLLIDGLKEVKSKSMIFWKNDSFGPASVHAAALFSFWQRRRICVDFRALTTATIRNNYPLPKIDEMWDQIGNSRYFRSISDLDPIRFALRNKNSKRASKQGTGRTSF